MADEGQIQLPPDSTGKGVRVLAVTTLINGTPTTVQMQVLTIADPATGKPLNLDPTVTLDALHIISQQLDRLIGVCIAGLKPNTSEIAPLEETAWLS
ncbi:MAG TPA: hypothetical protein VK600_00380 [Candidatus Saccharimonadales bacterium]|nr:hypothetical protein [Candidatus Saccharimonadales bacterium]